MPWVLVILVTASLTWGAISALEREIKIRRHIPSIHSHLRLASTHSKNKERAGFWPARPFVKGSRFVFS